MTDRELDALVAEKVMGWLRFHHHSEPEAWISGPGWATARKRDGVRRGDGGKPLGHLSGVPSYSTDISAAWTVVEKMRRNGFGVRNVLHARGENIVTVFYGGDFSDNREAGSASDASLPRAICLASLRALGVEVPR